jgi:hypothetical protein
MRASIAACVLGALCALAGGFLVGVWCLGVVLIAEGGLLAVWGVLRDDGRGPVSLPRPGQGATLAEVLERARAS